jgi:hypothetical protein
LRAYLHAIVIQLLVVGGQYRQTAENGLVVGPECPRLREWIIEKTELDGSIKYKVSEKNSCMFEVKRPDLSRES